MPVETVSRKEAIKFNLIQLVKDHRAKCDEHCNVSLFLVRELAEMAGLTITDDERHLFQ